MFAFLYLTFMSSMTGVISEQAEERDAQTKGQKIIDREVQAHWARFKDDPLVKVTMGVRRSGKTVFTHLLLKGEGYASVNFDDERLAYMDSEDLNDVLEGLYEVYGDFDNLVLDEVQNVQGWELFVNRLQRAGKRVYVTGSNANLLSRELATHLTGRYVQMEIHPFSFREFLLWNDKKLKGTTTKERAVAKRMLEDYMSMGGFPEVLRNPDLAGTYLHDLYSSILAKDIISRRRVRYVRTFREMALGLVSSYSQLITYNKLKKVHGLKSSHTAKDYVGHLEEAYLVHLLDKYSPKPKEVLASPKKVYIADTGLIKALALTATEDRGRIMENMVFLELARRRAIDPAMELYYWRDYQDREVDFVIKRGPRVEALVQSTYASEMDEIDKREVRSLLKGRELMRTGELQVITWDVEAIEEVRGNTITYIPLWRWLLDGLN
jgi:predicted AAA+ superfamily ATPase